MGLVEDGQRDYRGKLRSRYQTVNDDPSMTVQSDAHLADIQQILKKFGATGIIEHLDDVQAQYADISEFSDYADVMRHVRMAEEGFMKLPAQIRMEFDNDVANWLDAAHDPDKRVAIADDLDDLQEAVDVIADAAEEDRTPE